MANRSYLYSINEVPTANSNDKIKIIGLSEFNYEIPVAYKVLLSGGTKSSHSIIFDGNYGITGDYQKGLENLKRYISSLKNEKIPNKEKLIEDYDKAINFLSNPDNQQEFFQLEIGEIIDISPKGEDLYEETLNNIKELETMFERVRGDMMPAYEMNINDWEKELGLDYWNNHLYFDFSQNNN